jgi:glycosyltransferase involved in cell wall biosynthesis
MSTLDRAATRLCVVGSGWQFTSGISYYTCRLTNALAAEYAVSTILMRRLIPRLLYPGRHRVGVRMHDVHYAGNIPVFDGVDWFALPSLIRGVRFLRKQRPELVIFQWWTGAVLHSYVVLAWIARRLGAKVVIEFHEVQDTGEARAPGVARYVATLGRRFLTRADGYIVHSEHDRAAIASAYGIVDHPIRVAPHGPFDHHSVAGPTDDLQQVDEDRPTRLLFFGTIRPYKGLEHLVTAFNALTPDEAERFELHVMGETWEGWTLPVDLIESSPHRSRITLVNRYLTDDEIAAAFSATDVVLLPYTRSSASGPLHIAMAYGRPVVLTDVGGLRDGASGYDGVTWVPPSDPDALQATLLTLPSVRGQHFPDPRSWSDTVTAIQQLEREVRP